MMPALLVLLGYLMGSLSAAVIVCRIIGAPDPRTSGSGNPGATNVLRVAGKKAATATLLGDSLKGLLPVLAGRALGLDIDALAAVAFATFLGHLYPIFFGFHGGKGVATFIGVLLGLAWPLGVLYIVAWLLVAKVGRVSSLAALIAAALTPMAALLMHQPAAVLAAIVAMVLLLFWRHRANIRRIASGSESRIDDKEAGASDSIES